MAGQEKDLSLLTDEELNKKYLELDYNVRNHPIIKEIQLRGLIKGKNNPPKGGTFKSVTKL